VTVPLSVSRLEALLESAELLHSSLDLDDLLRHLLRSVMGRLVVSRALVAVEREGVLEVAIARGVRGVSAGQVFDRVAAERAGIALFVPIGQETAPVGVLGLGLPPTGRVDEPEVEFLRALAGLAASGIENARAHAEVQQLNRRLDRKIHELKALLDLVRALTSIEDPDEVAQLLGLTLAGQWLVARYAIVAEKPGHPVVIRQKGTTLGWPVTWWGEVAGWSEAVRVEDLPEGPARRTLEHEEIEVVFPMRSATGPVGLVALGMRPGGRPYTDADGELGAGLVAQSAVALENAWHLREVLEKKQIERELMLAASIQQGLFPAHLPRLAGCDLAATSRPARQVGGDYYDALSAEVATPLSRWLLCVADVSGKGIGASLLMSNIQATLRALLGREASLAELARVTNELLYLNTPGNKYVTAILLAVDPGTGRCSYVNGGHNEGLVLRASGEVEWLPATGLALGLFPGMRYDEPTLTLGDGDVVALYSDGVTEAQNAAEEEFGNDRLVAVVRQMASEPASRIVSAVLSDIDAFAADAPQHDDITLMILKRARPATHPR
jgi:phosphoserine phosphatase RsbU/P